jgi:FkbM family methyltransferase
VAPDWRWLLKREDTVWYPQTRLFRQTRLRDWHGVFERMAVELTRLSPKIRVKSPESYRIASTGMNRLNSAKHGLMLYNRHDAYIGRSLETYGEFSDDELTVFRQVVRPGSIVVEAGANIGTHTVELSRIVGEQGRVYAFEPQRIVFQTLCANVQLNSRNNVICRQEAVGEAEGVILVPPIDYRSANNFGGLALGSYREGEPVPVVRIDDLKLPHCGLIKCDVEGMEVSVLKGAKETIEKFRPVLYVENDRRERSPALIEFLMSLDYDCYWDLPVMYRRGNFYANPENVFSQIRSINMLCVPKKANANIEGMRRVTGPNDWWQTA